jgi:UDP-glucuronate decarboxylase
LRIKVARIFNTYGPRMLANDGRVVSNFIVQALKGEPITIYGAGTQTRSFCYVDDLVAGLVKLMNSADEVTGPINLGNPLETSVRALAEEIIRRTKSASKIEQRPLPADDPVRRQPDISRAKEILDWRPATVLGDGLDHTIAYFRAVL